MPNLVPSILPHLQNYRIPHLDTGAGTIHPNYHGYSLANIPASVCHWLGIPGLGQPPLAPEILSVFPSGFKRVILILVDGLGLFQLQNILLNSTEPRLAFWRKLTDNALLAPLTSIAPSTTSSALTTLWTGRTPAEHGVVGYEMFIKEYSMIANMIAHSPATFGGDVGGLRRAGFNPEAFLPVETLGQHLGQHGVKPYAFQHSSIARSGLSTMMLQGVNVVPFRNQSDLWVTLPELIESQVNERTYTYVYWGDVDELSHRFGPGNERIPLEVSHFTYLLERAIMEIARTSHDDTLMLLTADHGQILTPRNPIYELRNHPEVLACLHMLPACESRFAFLYVKPGKEAQLMEYVELYWPGQFKLVRSEHMVQTGLLGEGTLHPKLMERVGDWLLVAQDEAFWWWQEKDNLMLGRHGGLSPEEMLIPLLGWVV